MFCDFWLRFMAKILFDFQQNLIIFFYREIIDEYWFFENLLTQTIM